MKLPSITKYWTLYQQQTCDWGLRVISLGVCAVCQRAGSTGVRGAFGPWYLEGWGVNPEAMLVKAPAKKVHTDSHKPHTHTTGYARGWENNRVEEDAGLALIWYTHRRPVQHTPKQEHTASYTLEMRWTMNDTHRTSTLLDPHSFLI